MNHRLILVIGVLAVVGVLGFLLLPGTGQAPAQPDEQNNSGQPAGQNIIGGAGETQGAQIANPASEFCVKQGGKLDIMQMSNGNEHGMCILPDGRNCEEWSFYRGGCEAMPQMHNQ